MRGRRKSTPPGFLGLPRLGKVWFGIWPGGTSWAKRSYATAASSTTPSVRSGSSKSALAFTKCREVLDELEKYQATPTPQWPDWATQRRNWGVAERLVATQAALRHMTHAGPHAAIGNSDEHAVRLAVTMTAALLRY
jgi:hypothetical protein